MEPAGGRLSDYFTAAARRVVVPPNAKHGSEDEHDRRSPTIRGSGLYPKASPESPFMGRIEKPSETGESRPSQTRLSRVEGELQRAAHIREAEVATAQYVADALFRYELSGSIKERSFNMIAEQWSSVAEDYINERSETAQDAAVQLNVANALTSKVSGEERSLPSCAKLSH